MKAIVLAEANGPESISFQAEPIPTPRPGEVRVAVRAASLNHRELWISRGQYPGMKLPCILGADGAGVIEAVGEGVDPSRIGEEVVLYPALYWGDNAEHPSADFCLLGMPVPGTLAEFICVPASNAAAKPKALSFGEAAALPTAALTAWRAVTRKGRVGAGDKVLITGIGGGVATFSLKFAVAMGADVHVTSGSERNIAHAKALGAAAGYDYTDENWGKAARKASGGFNVVIDGAPAASFSSYARSLALGARVVLYGSTGGATLPLNAPELFLRHATIHGTAMGNLDDFNAMLAFVSEQGIKPEIDATLPFAETPAAFAQLQGAHFGKIVIEI